MTKMIKLSLVAAVAVAGLSTTASAGSLEEAIKGVNINGKVEVGYNNNDNKMTGVSTNQVEYDLDLKATVPVNDKITATVAVQADHVIDVDDNLTATSDSTDITAISDITLTQANFTYVNGGTTVITGKQSLNTPFEDDRRGDGIVAVQNFGAVTAAAAHFSNVNLSTAAGGVIPTVTLADVQDETINAFALIGAFGGINGSFWYLSSTVVDGYSLNVNGKIEGISFDARHTAVELDNPTGNPEDQTLTKLTASMAVDNITLIAGVAKTNDDNVNALARGVQTESDADFYLNQLHLGDYASAKAVLLGASMPIGATSLTALYLTGSIGDSGAVATRNGEFHEINLEASYSMSNNFTLSGTFSTAEIENNAGVAVLDNDALELSLLYTF